VFLRNAWYVVALSRELADRPLQRRILDEPLALFRTASGRAAAITDRCPHRGAPISSGEIQGETLVCGYHGFAFGTDGQCTDIPGMAKIPRTACARAWPVAERWGWVFAWMGDPARADETLLPPLHWMSEPGWTGRTEMLPVKADYTLVRDNLLDLTHARYVHRKTLGTSAVTEHPVRTEVDGQRVRVIREMPDIEPSPFFKRMGGFAGRVDHRQQIDFVPPCYVIINTRVCSTQASGEGRAAEFQVLNALTPVHAGATHYFWGLVRNFATDDEGVTDTQQTLNRTTFEEDVSILEQQQGLIESAPADWRPLATPNDAGCVQATRLMDRLLEAEKTPTGTP
jgi:vanillate O-demethylase monooxygenase subunit